MKHKGAGGHAVWLIESVGLFMVGVAPPWHSFCGSIVHPYLEAETDTSVITPEAVASSLVNAIRFHQASDELEGCFRLKRECVWAYVLFLLNVDFFFPSQEKSLEVSQVASFLDRLPGLGAAGGWPELGKYHGWFCPEPSTSHRRREQQGSL